MVRSRKPLLLVPLHKTATIPHSEPTCVILMDTRRIPTATSPDPQWKASTASHRRTSERTNEQIYPPPNPQGDRPRSIRPLAVNCRIILPGGLVNNPPWFSLSPLNGLVALREGLATGA